MLGDLIFNYLTEIKIHNLTDLKNIINLPSLDIIIPN